MKIIARGGKDRYLIETENALGFVINVADKVRFPEMLVDAILKFGNWKNTPDDQDLIKESQTYTIVS